MHRSLTLLILPTLLSLCAAGYSCPPISQFYTDCSNLYPINQSMALCSRLGMRLLNITDSTMSSNLLQSINCTADFWYGYSDGTIRIGNFGSTTGGVSCPLYSLLGIYCVYVVQASTICMRTNQTVLQQKCPNNDPNQRSGLQRFTFIRTTTYGSSYQTFPTRSKTQCASICTERDQCIGITYNQSICTLYA